jgi:hypothetical protein
MTWTTFFLIWCVSGFLNGLYTVKKEWHTHKIFDATAGYKLFHTVGMLILGTITGFIGIVVTIWEHFDSRI